LWYTSGTQVVYKWYTSGTQVVHKWYTSGIKVVYKWYTSGIQVVHKWYTSGIQVVHKWYTSGIQVVHKWYTSGTPTHAVSASLAVLGEGVPLFSTPLPLFQMVHTPYTVVEALLVLPIPEVTWNMGCKTRGLGGF